MSPLSSALAAAVLTASAVALAAPVPPTSPVHRPRRATEPGPAHSRPSGLGHPLAWVGGSVLLAAAVWSWVGGPVGLGAGAAAGAVVGLLGPRAAQRRDRETSSTPEQTALAADLLTAALEAGLPVGTALDATGHALGGSLGQALRDAAGLQVVGADAAASTRALRAHPGSARLGRAVARAQESGMAPGAVLAAAALAERERQRSQHLSRARSAGSIAALPVGLLFLPAFVLVTVVPLVLGAISGVLS